MPTARRARRRLRNRARCTGVRRRRSRIGPRAHRARRRTDGHLDAGGDVVDRDAAGGGPPNALGAGVDACAASGRRTDRRDRAPTAGGRLPAGNPVCRGCIRHLAAGDRAALRAVRPCRGNEGRRRHPHRGHRGRGCACRRGLFGQLPVLVGSGAAGNGIDAGPAARRYGRGSCARRATAPGRRRDQLAGGPRAGTGAAGGRGAHRRVRRCRRDAALAVGSCCRRRRRRHPSIRRHHHRPRRSRVRRAAAAASGAGPPRPGIPAMRLSWVPTWRRQKLLPPSDIRGCS